MLTIAARFAACLLEMEIPKCECNQWESDDPGYADAAPKSDVKRHGLAQRAHQTDPVGALDSNA